MDQLAIALLLVAALLHSAWHALIKTAGDRLVGLAGMNIVSTGVSLALLPLVSIPEVAVWPVLLFSVVLHNLYKVGLAQVYRHGDLSQAYPIARGLSPLFATLIAWGVLGEVLVVGQLAGVGLVSIGLITIGLERRNCTLSPALLASAGLTGLLVAAYSVVDAYGTRLSGDWVSYAVWLVAMDGVAFVAMMSHLRGRILWMIVGREWRRTLISGLLGVGAFGVFLWALSRGAVGGVAALRETSVLFASLIGIFVLKEHGSMARFLGAVLITAGIIVFAAHAGGGIRH